MNRTVILNNTQRLAAATRRFAVAHPRRVAGAAAAFTLILACFRGSGPELPPPPVVPDAVQATPAPAARPTRAELAEAAWKRAFPKIVATETSAFEELKSRVAQLGSYFDERKAGADAFAREVTSLEGQMQFVGGIGEQALTHTANGLHDAVLYFFGTGLFDKKLPLPDDRFAAHVRDKFREQVLDPAAVNRAIKSAVSGYTSRLQVLENELLVDLKADLSDLSVGGAVQFAAEEFHLPDHLDGLVSEATATVGDDLIIAVIQDQVADQIGNIASGMIKGFIADMGGDVSKVRGLETTIDMGADIGVSQAISKGLEAGGYDPAGKIKLKVAACLDRLKLSVIDGDKETADIYSLLIAWRFGHPDGNARSACEAALRKIESDPRLGLMPKLGGLNARKAVQRQVAILTAIFGEQTTPFLFFTDDPRVKHPAADVIRLVNECATLYGVDLPK